MAYRAYAHPIVALVPYFFSYLALKKKKMFSASVFFLAKFTQYIFHPNPSPNQINL